MSKPIPSATVQYRRHAKQVKALVRDINAALARHARAQKAHPGHWGYAGDLASVRVSLNSIKEFLA
jgi:phenylpyruvate tautomerase PptA (4-oxalocrotonate tautomerase family)